MPDFTRVDFDRTVKWSCAGHEATPRRDSGSDRPARRRRCQRRRAELEARAILPADAVFPAPFGGVVNTDPAPAPGATQPVGGFSALLDAGNGDFYAMPDNGFGAKANSAASSCGCTRCGRSGRPGGAARAR